MRAQAYSRWGQPLGTDPEGVCPRRRRSTGAAGGDGHFGIDGFHVAWIGSAVLLAAAALLLLALLRRRDVVAVSEGEAVPVAA
jgi:hypothetical protein